MDHGMTLRVKFDLFPFRSHLVVRYVQPPFPVVTGYHRGHTKQNLRPPIRREND